MLGNGRPDEAQGGIGEASPVPAAANARPFGAAPTVAGLVGRVATFWRRAAGIYASYKARQIQHQALRLMGHQQEELETTLWDPHHKVSPRPAALSSTGTQPRDVMSAHDGSSPASRPDHAHSTPAVGGRGDVQAVRRFEGLLLEDGPVPGGEAGLFAPSDVRGTQASPALSCPARRARPASP